MCAMHSVSPMKQHLQQSIVTVDSPDKPPTSIFFKFFASRMTTVSLPAVGTQRREKQMSPSFSCYENQQRGISELSSVIEMFVLQTLSFPQEDSYDNQSLKPSKFMGIFTVVVSCNTSLFFFKIIYFSFCKKGPFMH